MINRDDKPYIQKIYEDLEKLSEVQGLDLKNRNIWLRFVTDQLKFISSELDKLVDSIQEIDLDSIKRDREAIDEVEKISSTALNSVDEVNNSILIRLNDTRDEMKTIINDKITNIIEKINTLSLKTEGIGAKYGVYASIVVNIIIGSVLYVIKNFIDK